MREKIIAVLMTFLLAACGSSVGGGSDLFDQVDDQGCGVTVAKTITSDSDQTVTSQDGRAILIVTTNIPAGSSFRPSITVLCGFGPPSLNSKGYLIEFTGQIVPQYNLVITYNVPPSLTDESILRMGKPDPTFPDGWQELPGLSVDRPSSGTLVGLGLTDNGETYGIFVAQSGGGGGTDTTAPSRPTIHGLQVNQGTIVINWDESEDNSGGTGVKGYDVYRGIDNVSLLPITPVATSPGSIAGTSYTDIPPGIGTQRYCYAIRAVDNA
ncbi:MAG: hypothetical protein L0Y56_01030, partial [Nitrospira sp.]|nr:hypothetical protein [Nitrospira sp.]